MAEPGHGGCAQVCKLAAARKAAQQEACGIAALHIDTEQHFTAEASSACSQLMPTARMAQPSGVQVKVKLRTHVARPKR